MTNVIAYEERLNRDRPWALREGSRHFEKESAVHESLRRVAHRLDELGVPCALAGGMAMFLHGYRRFTEEVDILVTREGLATIHDRLDGLGYISPFQGSKTSATRRLGYGSSSSSRVVSPTTGSRSR